MVLQPPPAADYPTLEALVEAVQAHAVAKEYAVDVPSEQRTRKASRGGKHKVGRGGRGGAIIARGKAIRKEQKNKELASVIVATIDADIQTLNEGFTDNEEDVRGIITRQTARRAAGATKNSATFKGATHVDDEDETNADGDGDADSDDD